VRFDLCQNPLRPVDFRRLKTIEIHADQDVDIFLLGPRKPFGE
jgi:hypothetical protein